MSEKILVADDSTTIQKVIQITLAKMPYQLVECLDETTLDAKIKQEKYDLVLLDFTFSQNKTGYDLARELKTHAPNTPVMIMMGTFDTVDNKKIADSGIQDWVVKPFESSKFIQKCVSLIEAGDSVATRVIDNIGEDWMLNAPDVSEKDSQKDNSLSGEVEEWMSPDETNTPSSDLISMDEFEKKIDEEEPTVEYKMPLRRTKDNEKKEPLDISPEHFWTDDEEDVGEGTSIISMSLDENDNPVISDTTDDTPTSHDHNPAPKETDTPSDFKKRDEYPIQEEMNTIQEKISLDDDQIIAKIKESIHPVLEELVKTYCREKIEQVAWEVIPDLAENLIQKELKNLSDNVLKSSA